MKIPFFLVRSSSGLPFGTYRCTIYYICDCPGSQSYCLNVQSIGVEYLQRCVLTIKLLVVQAQAAITFA